MNRWWLIPTATLSAAIAVSIQRALLQADWSLVVASVVATIVGVVIQWSTGVLLPNTATRSSFGRRAFEPSFALEGIWVESTRRGTDRDEYHAYIEIRYDPSSRDFLLEGYTFDPEGRLDSKWTAEKFQLDTKYCAMRTSFESRSCIDPGQTTNGYTEVTFEPKKERPFQSGTGYYIETGNPRTILTKWAHPTREQVVKLINKPTAVTEPEKLALIKEYAPDSND